MNDNERLRREHWSRCFADIYARMTGADCEARATRFANLALEEYDKRFTMRAYDMEGRLLGK